MRTFIQLQNDHIDYIISLIKSLSGRSCEKSLAVSGNTGTDEGVISHIAPLSGTTPVYCALGASHKGTKARL